MRILFLSFYFEPDLSACSFRSTSLFNELLSQMGEKDFIHVITTKPNRYSTFSPDTKAQEENKQYRIDRIEIPKHKSGFIDQMLSYRVFYRSVFKLIKDQEYDLVYATSSRLFTALIGRRAAYRKKAFLYLDIRDIFVDTILNIFQDKYIIKTSLSPILNRIEKYTFSKANHINLVSKGFAQYFEKYPKPQYTYFSNGIDQIFIDAEKAKKQEHSDKIIITYAGNIGEGQGLEKIIPPLAQELGNNYEIRIIGEGGRRKVLEETINNLGITNTIFINPVNRTKLMEYYLSSDFLFLHLNNYKAFEKVLPSKIFEYGTYNVPILAGVDGYAASFIKEHIPFSFVFAPGNYAEVCNYIKTYKKAEDIDRKKFIRDFSREKIMKEMTKSILMKGEI